MVRRLFKDIRNKLIAAQINKDGKTYENIWVMEMTKVVDGVSCTLSISSVSHFCKFC